MREQMLLDRTAVLKSLVLCEISTYHVQILAANPGLAEYRYHAPVLRRVL